MEVVEVDSFLKDLTFNSNIILLEQGKDDKELLEVAKRNGLNLPDHDIAVIKCVYAFVDRHNKNGCLLPRAEVEKALFTLKGKAVDIDHLRKSTVGYWLEGSLQGDKIIAYAAIWKDNFPEDYEIMKEMLRKGNLCVSFEAYGNRTYTNNSKTLYTLNDISFAGGAVLLKTQPAFEGADVLEMAKNRVLELASIMKNNIPSSFLHERGSMEFDYENFEGTEQQLEEAMEDEEYSLPLSADEVDTLETAKKLSYQERKSIPNEHFAVVKNVKGKSGKTLTVRKFPIADPAHVRNALARLPQATKSLEKLGVSPATVKSRILKRARELKMTELLKRHSKGGSGGGDTYNDFDGDGGAIERARMYVADMDHIMRNLQEVDCSNCGESMLDPTYIDYGNNSMGVTCANCGSQMKVDMSPTVTMTKKGRKIKQMQELVQKPMMDSMASIIYDPEISAAAVEPAMECTLVNLPYIEKSKRNDLKDDDFAVVKTFTLAENQTKKVRIFPIHDARHIDLACQVLSTAGVQDFLRKLDISLETVDKTIQRKVLSLAMKEQMKKYGTTTPLETIQAAAKQLIGRELNEAELKKALEEAYSIFELHDGPQTRDAQTAPSQPGYSVIGLPKGKGDYNGYSVWGLTFTDNQFNRLVEKASGKDTEMDEKLKKELDEAKAKIAQYETEKAAAEKARKEELVKARKAELTEEYVTANKITDEDLLNDLKFELEKTKKELASVKSGKAPIKASVTPKVLAKGSAAPESGSKNDDEISAARKRVNELAFNSRRLSETHGHAEVEE